MVKDTDCCAGFLHAQERRGTSPLPTVRRGASATLFEVPLLDVPYGAGQLRLPGLELGQAIGDGHGLHVEEEPDDVEILRHVLDDFSEGLDALPRRNSSEV